MRTLNQSDAVNWRALLGQCLGFPSCRVGRLVILFFLVALPILCAEEEGSSPDGPTVFEQFKKFIEDPPPIEDIVFSYQGTPISRFDPITKKDVKEPAPVQFIRARWGTDYLLNVSVPSLRDLETEPLSEQFVLRHGEMLVQCRNEFWRFNGPARTVIRGDTGLVQPSDLSNAINRSCFLRTLPLFATMNMGVHLVPPRTVRWSGNRFECLARVPIGDLHFEGELFPGPNGFPERMSYRIRGVTGDGRYLARYEYASNTAALARFIPHHIRSVVFRGTNEYTDKDIRLFSLRVGTTGKQAGNRADQTSRWINQNGISQIVYTNLEYYTVEPGGLRLIPRHVKTWKPPFVLAHTNRYYYVACGLLFAGFLVLNWRMRRQTKQTE